MRVLLLLIVLAMSGGSANIFAQSSDTLTKGNALIFKDPRIDYLQKVYSAKSSLKVVPKKVYRVQIIISKSRSEVNDAKAKFASKYPEIPVFLSFEPPTFKLRAGTFVSRQDAQTFLKEVRKMFPSSFIVE
ncbi:MAG TPA: SPOR domain-containing protein [Chitinophagales bacterium]|nr:SPOR domain-containing protein [Chitinophagales bacterium]